MPFNFQTVISKILNLKRTCPKCKRDPIVPTSKGRKRFGAGFVAQLSLLTDSWQLSGSPCQGFAF